MIKKVGWGFGRCNQFCKHCYNASTAKAPQYSFATLKEIADKICLEITDINFGTGEFIVNPNALLLARYIREKYPHIVQAVTSNGSTIIQMAPTEIKHLFHDVDISLDFPSENRHNEFRGHPLAWKWANGALQILKELEVPRTLVTCVNSSTTNDDIEKLLEIAEKYDALWRINWFRQTGRGDASLRISAKRTWDIIRFLSKKVKFVVLDSIFGAVLRIPCKPCPAGHYTCRIHENLNMSPYPFLKGPQWNSGNIADPSTNLKTVYESEIFKNLRERQAPFCKDCPFFKECRGGCATRSVLHNGGINQPDDYCPVQAKLDIKSLQEISIEFTNSINLVHDGYLCTTIVKPGKEK